MSAIDVEGPDGFAEDSSHSGEEVGDGGAGVVVVEDVAACFIVVLLGELLFIC